MDKRVDCDSCCLVMINGKICHETGCPKSHINPMTGDMYERECKECGGKFIPEEKGQDFCSDLCQTMYWGGEFPIEDEDFEVSDQLLFDEDEEEF